MGVLSALLVCLVMYRRNTCQPCFSAVFGLDSAFLSVSDLGVGPADCWHCVASVDGGLCAAWRLPVVTGIIIIISFLNSRFYKALHSGRDMRRLDKMTKISLLFSPKLKGMF